MPTESFYSHGKLLLTGEYLVLDGALALGLPTKFGQQLQVRSTVHNQTIQWKSKLQNQEIWLDLEFKWNEQLQFSCVTTSQEAIKLVEIMNWIAQQNTTLFSEKMGYEVTSTLEFPKDWGLGSSSTLINNLAQWCKIDAFALQEFSFGGSGYDVACAQHSTPIVFSKNEIQIHITEVQFAPSYKEELFFVYLNQKQNSRDAIKHYRSQSSQNVNQAIQRINSITNQIIEVTQIEHFEALVRSHEKIIASLLGQFPIQKRLFHDYPRTIKSLGAWGGDFILATGRESEKNYFREKGYNTILSFKEMVR